MIQDDKEKKDVDMKPESPTTEKHGDVSPITGSISNLADTPPAPEPTSEKLTNFSRVTPAQMVHITFPSDCRYQPVRLVSSQPAPSRRAFKALISTEKYAGGGGILLLVDQRPGEEPSYIEFTEPAVAPQAEERTPTPVRHISLDANAPEAAPPEPFEVGR
jgi:26S proteasome regulatory subunit N2